MASAKTWSYNEWKEDNETKHDIRYYQNPEFRKDYAKYEQAKKAEHLQKILKPSGEDFLTQLQQEDLQDGKLRILDLCCGPSSASIAVCNLISVFLRKPNGRLPFKAVEFTGVDQFDWGCPENKTEAIIKSTLGLIKISTSCLFQYECMISKLLKSEANKFHLIVMNYAGLGDYGIVKAVSESLLGPGGWFFVNDNNLSNVKDLATYGFDQVPLKQFPGNSFGVSQSILMLYKSPKTNRRLTRQASRQRDGPPLPQDGAKRPKRL